MARKTQAELEQAVLDAVQAAGGTVTHSDLVQTLEAGGNRDAAMLIISLSQRGAITPHLKVQADSGKPILRYSLGGG